MKNVIFINDVANNPRGWKKWVALFEKKGYNCLIAEWPKYEWFSEKMNQNISNEQWDQAMDEVYREFENKAINIEKPILIGRSFGGLLVQKLIYNGIGIAGICVDTAETESILPLDWGFLNNSIMLSNPYQGDEAFFPDFESFHEAFCSSLSIEEAKALFYIYTHQDVDKPDWIMADREKEDKGKLHPPLLFMDSKDSFNALVQNEINPLDLAISESVDNEKGGDFDDEHRAWEEIAECVEAWLHKELIGKVR